MMSEMKQLGLLSVIRTQSNLCKNLIMILAEIRDLNVSSHDVQPSAITLVRIVISNRHIEVQGWEIKI